MDITVYAEKDPLEEVTVEFDYSDATASVSAPVVTSYLKWYETTADGSPSAVLSGAPQVVGAKVYQKIVGGVASNDYLLFCLATTAEGDKLAIPAVLPVRSKHN